MIRLNLMLLAAVMVSAFYLVHTQYEFRRLYTAVDRAQSQSRRLEADHEQLRVQKQAQATSARVQQIATRQLKMRPVNPGITEYVTVHAAPVAAATEEGRP
ncbi:cell division protein FtsL [Hydrogenophaga sp.]|jgi:cell division protein FtsL|uniref:cell division protein FtsL n=1 Tax=Hydrogenophaga sp. TaxID=1904254 RepID=UPI0027158919|nr:cell division protein FtsL [Hydrogenophaga sp.]MDO9253408.1 cell division protein FtsL [Hydrogenophaga sp.]MDP3322428.1 cell division protein FtsL [Hydrogenophaga sp.]MDP3886578.1 cell division protein FtsL [Hydrogenophaga sp.]